MKRIKIGLLIISLFISTNIVKADTIINIQYGGSNYSELYYLNNLTWDSWYNYYDENQTPHSCNGRQDCYNQALSYFSSLNYSYYSMFVQIYPQSDRIELWLIPFNFSSNELMTQTVYSSDSNINRYRFYVTRNNEQYNTAFLLDGFTDSYQNNFYMMYDTNYNFKNDGDYLFKGFFDNENDNPQNYLKIDNNGDIPLIKNLIQYNSWSDYESNHLQNYTTVNLDDYEYVLLTLKDYSQTNAFQTDLQVKGQIGITPIYNYGQTTKDSITGVKVQDRCNLSYENYTSYPFYIIQSDLQNNVIYAVKECSQGGSFKFDNTVFNITYVTEQNADNPTVTIDGKTYNVIPYDDLPSTATQNEEENYIPGESGSANDTGGLDSAIKNVQQKMSEIWNTFTYFTDFVSQIFSALPAEVRTILISAFVITVVLGLIKIFIGH